MSNQAVETVVSAADRVKVGLAIAVFLAGMIAYYALDKQPGYVRTAVLLGGAGGGRWQSPGSLVPDSDLLRLGVNRGQRPAGWSGRLKKRLCKQPG